MFEAARTSLVLPVCGIVRTLAFLLSCVAYGPTLVRPGAIRTARPKSREFLEAFAMTNKPSEPTSPVCLTHEGDDAYMGFASRAEIAAFLNELLEAERAGTTVALRSAEQARRSL